MSVAGVILAAGASTRLGRPKQLARVSGRDTLLEIAVRALRGSRCALRAVVLGSSRAEIESATDLEGLTVIGNDAWPTGMASSVRAAVAWATPLPCTGLLLMVCDQPHLDHLHLDALIAALGPTQNAIGSAYNGTIGVPAAFSRAHFPDLAALTGDRGARALLVRPGVTAIPWPAGAIDIDTPADLAAHPPPAERPTMPRPT